MDKVQNNHENVTGNFGEYEAVMDDTVGFDAEAAKRARAMAEEEMAIIEKQRFIENPELRKKKIRRVLQELDPKDIDLDNPDYSALFDEGLPTSYQGDNANDFVDAITDKGFILKHMDDLIACGAELDGFNEWMSDGWYGEEDALLSNIDIILSHIGHGIDKNAFLESIGILPRVREEMDAGDNNIAKNWEMPYSRVAEALLGNDPTFDYDGKYYGEIIEALLRNGAPADQLLVEPIIWDRRDYDPESHDYTFYDNDKYEDLDDYDIEDAFMDSCNYRHDGIDMLVDNGVEVDKLMPFLFENYYYFGKDGYGADPHLFAIVEHLQEKGMNLNKWRDKLSEYRVDV